MKSHGKAILYKFGLSGHEKGLPPWWKYCVRRSIADASSSTLIDYELDISVLEYMKSHDNAILYKFSLSRHEKGLSPWWKFGVRRSIAEASPSTLIDNKLGISVSDYMKSHCNAIIYKIGLPGHKKGLPPSWKCCIEGSPTDASPSTMTEYGLDTSVRNQIAMQ